jgi:hypothetical protein
MVRDMWSRLMRRLHCLQLNHRPVDGTISFWCGWCGKEWVRSRYRRSK